MSKKVDILVMAVHPDDAELSCSGTIAKHIADGKKVAMVDFTTGDLGTRGTPEIRLNEALNSAKILGLAARENLYFRDGFFKNDEAHQLEVIKMIRKYQPQIILANAIEDRHPDHGRASQLVLDACFYSGLRMLETLDEKGEKQNPWRPASLYNYIQDRYIEPDFVVDITPFWKKKIDSIKAFSSQFFDPNSKEPESYISSPEFLDFIRSRAEEMGHKIGVKYGEGFTKTKMIGVNSLFDIH
jgi:bacillithiol biosynthesis deacetylase BshB1